MNLEMSNSGEGYLCNAIISCFSGKTGTALLFTFTVSMLLILIRHSNLTVTDHKCSHSIWTSDSVWLSQETLLTTLTEGVE